MSILELYFGNERLSEVLKNVKSIMLKAIRAEMKNNQKMSKLLNIIKIIVSDNHSQKDDVMILLHVVGYRTLARCR